MTDNIEENRLIRRQEILERLGRGRKIFEGKFDKVRFNDWSFEIS
jgi:hypothetical protein